VLAIAALGCGTVARTAERKQAAIYGPTESVLEVVAVLRRHVGDDTYRFAPATDFTGRNVYRASLLRLENIERIHAETLRSGHFDGVIAFAKARALERLRGYDLAAQHYREAAKRDDELAQEALRSAESCDAIAAAIEIGPQLRDPLAPGASPADASQADAVVAELDERIARLVAALGPEAEPSAAEHYVTIVREEVERADLARARWFEAMRFALPDGHVRAVSELQRVATRHAASHRHLRHLLALADLYAELAREYVRAVPPESLGFDPPHLRELVDAATHIYSRVASRDGAPEKLEASRRLEAFLAFTLQVDRDRFATR
jgi:tetratricopeptide (TPR) repeat protein